MKHISFWIKLLCFCLLFRMTERFCHQKTDGFMVSHILSNLPYDARRDVQPLAADELKEIESILSQPFTFLGSGGQAYAFLSQDGKTVLKLFKHHHLYSFSYLKAAPLPSFVTSFINKREEHRADFFQSCKIAYDELRQETGLLYLQLNKTDHWKRNITLIDKLGISHQVDLDNLEFALQKRASLALPSVKKLIRAGKKEEAKQAIASILNIMAIRCQKGIKDNDNGLRRNMGLLDNQAIAIDIGSFSKDHALAKPLNMEKELKEKTWRLSRYLEKNDKDLWHDYNVMLETLPQEKAR